MEQHFGNEAPCVAIISLHVQYAQIRLNFSADLSGSYKAISPFWCSPFLPYIQPCTSYEEYFPEFVLTLGIMFITWSWVVGSGMILKTMGDVYMLYQQTELFPNVFICCKCLILYLICHMQIYIVHENVLNVHEQYKKHRWHKT